MESVTGVSFKCLNNILQRNFDEADTLASVLTDPVNQDDLNIPGSPVTVTDNDSNIGVTDGETVHMLMSGSVVEGAHLCGWDLTNRSSPIDTDIMINFIGCNLNHVDQVECLKDVPGAPGHVVFNVTDHPLKELFKLNNLTVENNGNIFVSAPRCKACAADFLCQSTGGLMCRKEDEEDTDGKAALPGKCLNFDFLKNLHEVPEYDRIAESIIRSEYPHLSEEGISKMKADNQNILLCSSQTNDIDIVSCIDCEFWPVKQAAEWMYRQRAWPPGNIVDRIISGGYHIIPKASRLGNTELEWRISFSIAERILAENRTPTQQKVFYIFKSVNKERSGLKDVIHTYHLKTVMMWAMERRPPEYWREDNLSQCVLGLLNDLLHFVSTGNLCHYFMPQINLLDHIPQYSLVQEGKFIAISIRHILQLNRHTSLPLQPEMINHLSRIIGCDATRANYKNFVGQNMNIQKLVVSALLKLNEWSDHIDKEQFETMNFTEKMTDIIINEIYDGDPYTFAGVSIFENSRSREIMKEQFKVLCNVGFLEYLKGNYKAFVKSIKLQETASTEHGIFDDNSNDSQDAIGDMLESFFSQFCENPTGDEDIMKSLVIQMCKHLLEDDSDNDSCNTSEPEVDHQSEGSIASLSLD